MRFKKLKPLKKVTIANLEVMEMQDARAGASTSLTVCMTHVECETITECWLTGCTHIIVTGC